MLIPTELKMHNPLRQTLGAVLACTVACTVASTMALTCQAQDAPHIRALKYPADREAAVAVVGGQPISLGDLVDHIDARHHPGFRDALGKAPEIQRMLQSDLMAPWVRHFADIKAIEFVTKDQNVDKKKLEAALSERLRQNFQGWLDGYIADRRAAGHPTELSQEQINKLLARYQLNHGLTAELQGWLDYLEPGTYTRAELHEFFTNNARYFGGQVTIAHILVQHRDSGTGLLLSEEGLGRASARIADIKARLRPDGSNFEEVARLCSEDTKTAREGGELAGVRRFDDRLPASLCRAAWQLRDGQVSDVVESQYGWHLVKRIEFQQQIFVLFTDDAIPAIEIVMRRAMQEQQLFGAREAAKVELKL